MKATADHGRWRRTLPAQGSDRGFGALQLGIGGDLGPSRHRIPPNSSRVMLSALVVQPRSVLFLSSSETTRDVWVVEMHRAARQRWLGELGGNAGVGQVLLDVVDEATLVVEAHAIREPVR